VTFCAICGSDLHIFNGIIPQMNSGDVVGHETMGEVVEVGAENKTLKVGDRIVVPFTISCGECFFCKRGFFSGCERTNPDREKAATLWGNAPGGLFGYSHLLGGYAGGQAEYLRVPYADVGPIKVPAGLDDEQVLFLSDIFPTGYMGAEFCDIQGGETIAIWGAVHGHGPFLTMSPAENVLSIQMFLIVIAIPFLVLAAVIRERHADPGIAGGTLRIGRGSDDLRETPHQLATDARIIDAKSDVRRGKR